MAVNRQVACTSEITAEGVETAEGGGGGIQEGDIDGDDRSPLSAVSISSLPSLPATPAS